MKFVSADSTKTDSEIAVQDVVRRVQSDLAGSTPDLALLFVGGDHVAEAGTIAGAVQESLRPRHLLGCTAEAVIGARHEIEGEPAVCLLAGNLPEVEIEPFRIELEDPNLLLEDEEAFRAVIGASDPTVFLLLADPFSLPIDRVLSAFNQNYPEVPVVGGMASVAPQMGGNTLFVDDTPYRSGGAGVAMRGNLTAEVIVSQGCRPVGSILTVTRSERNTILELDHKPAVDVLREELDSLSEADKKLLNQGLFVGCAIRQDREEFGRGDFVIRNLLGYNPEISALVVADAVKKDSLVQFHLRDATTATEDLEMMLLPQSLLDAPHAGLIFSCNGRGSRLYGRPDGDIDAIQGSLGGNIPCAGFFCAGELGPIGGVNFIHGHTASMAFLRPKKTLAEM